MRSIFVKTYLKIALLTLVCLAAFVVYLDSALHDSDVEDFTAIGNLEAELLIHKLRAEPQVHWPDIIKNYKPSLPIATIEITQGILEGWKMMDEELGLFFHQDDDAWGIARSIDDTGQYIYLQEDITPPTFLDLLDSFGPAFLLFFMLGLSMFYLSHRIEVMVTELASGVSAFTDGQLSTRLKQDYEEPFETLSRNFNNMAERLERILNDQQVMIGALPHELRTPIARMRFALDTT
ncbi:MAG: hypothetical protein KDJ38_03845, partial [Gammaproteobacteria bacterium]|nr:hypothetical protein [Gammaproteobacteria bacterium]